MRVKLNYTKNTKLVPNNLQNLNSYINKLLGKNNPYHDKQSDYCCVGMLGEVITDGGRNLNYPNGGYIIFSTPDEKILNIVLSSLHTNTEYGYGMVFDGLQFIEEKTYGGNNLIIPVGNRGILLKGKDKNGKPYFVTPDNTDNYTEVITNQIINKFSKINPKLDFSEFSIEKIDKYRVSNHYVKNIRNTSTRLTLVIKTNKKVMEHLMNYGIGHSTGSGFGTICMHEDYKNRYPNYRMKKSITKEKSRERNLETA